MCTLVPHFHLPHTHTAGPHPPASHLMDLTFIKHHHFLHKLFEALTMRCLNSFLSHSFRSAEISLTRNITPVFLLRFVLKGGIVFRPISPPTIGIKCVFALVGRVWSWQRSFTAAAGAIHILPLELATKFCEIVPIPYLQLVPIMRAFTLYILIYKGTMPI